MSDLTGFGSLEEFGVLPTEQRLETSLAKPELPGAMRLGAINAISKARMRHQWANLLSEEMPNVKSALDALRAENPKAYLDKINELSEFALPKMKSVEVDHGSESSRRAQDLTLDELMGALSDNSVVSVQ